MIEPDGLNHALRRLVADLQADSAAALATFEQWCSDHSEDIAFRALVDYWNGI